MKRDEFRRFITVFLISAFIAMLILMIVLSKFYFDIGIVCPFHELFGWDCPGCGGTRMAVALLELDFYQAFRYNPFVFTTTPALVVVYVWQYIVYVKQNRLLKYLDAFLISYAIGLIIFGIIRNLSIFSWLAPTIV